MPHAISAAPIVISSRSATIHPAQPLKLYTVSSPGINSGLISTCHCQPENPNATSALPNTIANTSFFIFPPSLYHGSGCDLLEVDRIIILLLGFLVIAYLRGRTFGVIPPTHREIQGIHRRFASYGSIDTTVQV